MSWMLAQTAQTSGLDLWSVIWGAHPITIAVFAILLLCSVWSFAIMIERAAMMHRAWRAVVRGKAQLDTWAETKEWEHGREQISEATREDSPLFVVLRAGITCWDELSAIGETRLEVMESMMLDAMARELKMVRVMYRANLPVLANIASTAPFVGLFGTVVGIILTFNTIARTHALGPELVGSGIADALVATAMGLFAAIPALIAYNIFTDRVNQTLLAIEEIAMERVYFLVERSPVTAAAK